MERLSSHRSNKRQSRGAPSLLVLVAELQSSTLGLYICPRGQRLIRSAFWPDVQTHVCSPEDRFLIRASDCPRLGQGWIRVQGMVFAFNSAL